MSSNKKGQLISKLGKRKGAEKLSSSAAGSGPWSDTYDSVFPPLTAAPSNTYVATVADAKGARPVSEAVTVPLSNSLRAIASAASNTRRVTSSPTTKRQDCRPSPSRGRHNKWSPGRASPQGSQSSPPRQSRPVGSNALLNRSDHNATLDVDDNAVPIESGDRKLARRLARKLTMVEVGSVVMLKEDGGLKYIVKVIECLPETGSFLVQYDGGAKETVNLRTKPFSFYDHDMGEVLSSEENQDWSDAESVYDAEDDVSVDVEDDDASADEEDFDLSIDMEDDGASVNMEDDHAFAAELQAKEYEKWGGPTNEDDRALALKLQKVEINEVGLSGEDRDELNLEDLDGCPEGVLARIQSLLSQLKPGDTVIFILLRKSPKTENNLVKQYVGTRNAIQIDIEDIDKSSVKICNIVFAGTESRHRQDDVGIISEVINVVANMPHYVSVKVYVKDVLRIHLTKNFTIAAQKALADAHPNATFQSASEYGMDLGAVAAINEQFERKKSAYLKSRKDAGKDVEASDGGALREIIKSGTQSFLRELSKPTSEISRLLTRLFKESSMNGLGEAHLKGLCTVWNRYVSDLAKDPTRIKVIAANFKKHALKILAEQGHHPSEDVDPNSGIGYMRFSSGSMKPVCVSFGGNLAPKEQLATILSAVKVKGANLSSLHIDPKKDRRSLMNHGAMKCMLSMILNQYGFLVSAKSNRLLSSDPNSARLLVAVVGEDRLFFAINVNQSISTLINKESWTNRGAK